MQRRAAWTSGSALFVWTIRNPNAIAGEIRLDARSNACNTRAGSSQRGAANVDFISILSIFVMACFVGYYVVWSVTPALHTPLMAVTNAISSVIVVGALLAVGVPMISSGSGWARGFGFVALIFACVNIFGGFLVTQRMLAMYKKKAK